MKLSVGKRILVGIVAVIALLCLADEYPAMRFRGDGKFSGGPVLGYSIEFRKIPFYIPGEYVFHFRGAPREEMSLQLYGEGKSDDNRAELTNLLTQMEATLVDQSGRTLCHGIGIVPTETDPCKDCKNCKDSKVWTDQEIEARFQREWVLMSGPNETAYWHANCLRLPLKPSAVYSLTIRIKDVDPKTPRINLIPTLEGGQPDLP